MFATHNTARHKVTRLVALTADLTRNLFASATRRVERVTGYKCQLPFKVGEILYKYQPLSLVETVENADGVFSHSLTRAYCIPEKKIYDNIKKIEEELFASMIAFNNTRNELIAIVQSL